MGSTVRRTWQRRRYMSALWYLAADAAQVVDPVLRTWRGGPVKRKPLT